MPEGSKSKEELLAKKEEMRRDVMAAEQAHKNDRGGVRFTEREMNAFLEKQRKEDKLSYQTPIPDNKNKGGLEH